MTTCEEQRRRAERGALWFERSSKARALVIGSTTTYKPSSSHPPDDVSYDISLRIRLELLGRPANGTCDNRISIRCDRLETSILSGLDKHLMEPELFREFC